MARVVTALAAAGVFLVLVTANSGGYRYGVSDQAFYIPAIESSLDPALFPRDRELLASQARPWLLDDILGAVLRGRAIDMPVLIGVLYVAGVLVFGAGAVFFARGLGGSSAAIALALALLTLRHRIARTIPNSIEGYFHPRVMAFGLGLVALGFVLRRRLGWAAACAVLATIVHTPTGLWFGVMVAIAWLEQTWGQTSNYRGLTPIGGLVGAAAAVVAAAVLFVAGPRMDAEWLGVIEGRDYMFPLEWPAYAWIFNLAYLPIIWLIYRHRERNGSPRVLRPGAPGPTEPRVFRPGGPGERGLIAGAAVLLVGFLASVPLSSAAVTLALQAQVSRIFWMLDILATLYIAVWLAGYLTAKRSARWAFAAAAIVGVLSAGRGWYVLAVDLHRPLVQARLPADDWADAMDWLRTQRVDLHVLADPAHALKYGSSVRVGAARDTVIEHVKDAAMAMYDRPAALRVAERARTLNGFTEMTGDQLSAIANQFGADVIVVENRQRLALPALFSNAGFTIYQAR